MQKLRSQGICAPNAGKRPAGEGSKLQTPQTTSKLHKIMTSHGGGRCCCCCATVKSEEHGCSSYTSVSHPEEWLHVIRVRIHYALGNKQQLPYTLYKMHMTNVPDLPTYSALFIWELLSVSLSFVFSSCSRWDLLLFSCYSLFHDIPLPPRSPSSSPVNHHFPDDVSSLSVCQASTCSWCQFLWPGPHHTRILPFSLPAMHFYYKLVLPVFPLKSFMSYITSLSTISGCFMEIECLPFIPFIVFNFVKTAFFEKDPQENKADPLFSLSCFLRSVLPLSAMFLLKQRTTAAPTCHTAKQLTWPAY